MNCNAMKDRAWEFEDYLDGRLPEAESRAIESHMMACSECHEAMEAARLSMTLLRTTLEPAIVPGDEFWFRVRADILEKENELAGFWQPVESLAWKFSWAAAIVVALMGGYVMGLETRPELGAQAEVREIFRDPSIQPMDRDEVLLTLASRGNGR